MVLIGTLKMLKHIYFSVTWSAFQLANLLYTHFPFCENWEKPDFGKIITGLKGKQIPYQNSYNGMILTFSPLRTLTNTISWP
jgi:hypothetical protein